VKPGAEVEVPEDLPSLNDVREKIEDLNEEGRGGVDYE